LASADIWLFKHSFSAQEKDSNWLFGASKERALLLLGFFSATAFQTQV
jgi:hypothetical protein